MVLSELGWNDFFQEQLRNGVPGRVASSVRERFLVWTETGEVEVRPSGRLRRLSREWPAVGDWVVLRENAPVIDQVLTRKSAVIRKQPGKELCEQVLAANVDVLFIVSGIDRDYNPRRIERYLVLAENSGARAVIVLNKVDLVSELGLSVKEITSEIRSLSPISPVLLVSAASGQGLERFASLFSEGETGALVGSSGVGKSTIINRLLGEQRQNTCAVRADDGRGRHTTTHRKLFVIPGGWLLIDMPGLREIQLWTDDESVCSSFADVQQVAQLCRFRDCSHTTEPSCAVRTQLDEERLSNYHKLQRELAYLDRRSDGRLAREERQRWKSMEKSLRRHPKQSGTL